MSADDVIKGIGDAPFGLRHKHEPIGGTGNRGFFHVETARGASLEYGSCPP